MVSLEIESKLNTINDYYQTGLRKIKAEYTQSIEELDAAIHKTGCEMLAVFELERQRFNQDTAITAFKHWKLIARYLL